MDQEAIILGVGKYMSSYNLFCLFLGYKDVMKEPIHLTDLWSIKNALDMLWLQFVLSDFFYENPEENCFWRDSNRIIYISKDISKAVLCKEYDECFRGEFYINHIQSEKYSYEEASRGNGKLLWYPDCCVESFMETDGYDNTLFHMFSSKLHDYMNCSNYLNQFEYPILHHIACSFECRESIELAEKILPFYIKSANLNTEHLNRMFSEKTYILFGSLNWIKIENEKYSFWSRIKNNDPLFEKIKTLLTRWWFKIRIQEKGNIHLFHKEKEISINNIRVFHFPATDRTKNKYLFGI